jgi:hypothetical protein
MCYAHAWGKSYGYENHDAATEASLNKETSSILVAVPARDDKMAEVYQFPEERLKFVIPRAQTKDTGRCLFSVERKLMAGAPKAPLLLPKKTASPY